KPSNIQLTKLPALEHPFRLHKGVIRKIGPRFKLWFHIENFYKGSDGIVYCKGWVLSKLGEEGEDGQLREKKFNSLFALRKELDCHQYIKYCDLYHSNQFIYAHHSDDENIAGWLLDWIHC